ncbi:MAG TPA: exopolysaccharide biosynthesis protein [Alphaproteobacteria bacterium]
MLQQHTPIHADDNRHLSILFDAVLSRHEGQTVRIGTLLEALHERGFGVLLLFFALPLSIPIPKPPPVDTIMGIPLYYLCMQMILGRDVPLLPKSITERTVSVDILLKAFKRGRKWLEKFERLFHPRLTHIHEKQMARLCGCIGMISTCSVLVPFPMSNTVPSICMVIMSMGLVMRDNLAALAGGIFGAFWVLMLTCLTVFGASYVLDWMGNLF